MKDMIKRVREEKGGFTLAELLIVVAIILVLVAIAVPVFTGAQDSANKATRDANIRSAKSAGMVYVLENYTDTSKVPTLAADQVYQVKGNINPDGSVSISGVTAVGKGGTEYLGASGDAKATTGEFQVFIEPTELEIPTPPVTG